MVNAGLVHSGCRAVPADGLEQSVSGGVEGARGAKVAHGVGFGVEVCERDTGSQMGLGVRQRAQLVVGRTHVGGPVDAPDTAVGAPRARRRTDTAGGN